MPIMVMEAMVFTAMVAMDIQDTTEANALLMPMLTTVMATVVDTDMVDTVIQGTTEASAPLNHTTGMVVIMAVDTDMAVDTVTDMADKKLSSLHYLNFLN